MPITTLAKIKALLSKGAATISIVELISAYLGGSALAKVATKFITTKYSVSSILFPNWQEIPGFSLAITESKSADLTEFALIIIFSLSLFIYLIALFSFSGKKRNLFLRLAFLIVNLILFAETSFLSFSGVRVALTVFVTYTLYGFLRANSSSIQLEKIDPRLVINGLLFGFYLLILTSALTASVTIPLLLFISSPFLYLALGAKFGRYLNNPSHLIFIFSAFCSYKIPALVATGAIFFLSHSFRPKSLLGKKLTYLYAFAFVFLLAYNPLFYHGTFDPIEEGFWLGWLERLLTGQALYRDVAVYHPPGFIWGLYLFSKLASPSVYLTRLYFEVLRITGLFIIFILLSKIIKPNILRAIVFITLLISTQSIVRNNVEIRTALGILPLLFAASSPKSRQLSFPFLSGFFSSFAFFFSLEVGTAAFIVCFLNYLFLALKNNALRPIVSFISGAITGSLPFVGVLYLTSSLREFWQQMTFYATAFSAGYLSLPLPRNEVSNLLYWHAIYQYLDSLKWFWELSLLGLVTVFLLELKKFLTNNSDSSKLVFLLTIYGLLLSRVALGRSDVYHLFFILPLSLILLAHVLSQLSPPPSVSLVSCVFIFIAVYFFRAFLNFGFLENQLIKYQSYAKLPGIYPSYDLDRAQFTADLDMDVVSEKELISYLKDHVSQDEKIFVYPWSPEIYFLSQRSNATSYDTPLAFFDHKNQDRLLAELKAHPPALIVYNPDFHLSNLTAESLGEVNSYIKNNYSVVDKIGRYQILK